MRPSKPVSETLPIPRLTKQYNQEMTNKEPRCFPENAAERKTYPVYSGFVNYFPHAIAAVAKCSYEGNQQHHPDKSLHWDKSKSSDELDALMRHMMEGEWAQVAWRAMANLERKLTECCQYENSESDPDLKFPGK
mgnify:CR=1 FL=1